MHFYWGSLRGFGKISLFINLFIKSLLLRRKVSHTRNMSHELLLLDSVLLIPRKKQTHLRSPAFLALSTPHDCWDYSSCVLEAPLDLLSCHFCDKSVSPILHPAQSSTELRTVVLAILGPRQLSFFRPASRCLNSKCTCVCGPTEVWSGTMFAHFYLQSESNIADQKQKYVV